MSFPDTNSAGPSHSASEFLSSFPAESSSAPISTPVSQPRQVLKDRLYVGNLHPTVDEHTLIKLFSKFGKISKLDYLFHKSGMLKGKPRGYVFIEYANPDDARKAIAAAHDKLLRGRKLVVTYATQAPIDYLGGSAGSKQRKGTLEANRPTALSLIKTGMTGRNGTNDKIARLEAKLRQMESKESQSSSLPTSSTLPPKPSSAVTIPAFAASASQERRPSQSSSSFAARNLNRKTMSTSTSSFTDAKTGANGGILPSVAPRSSSSFSSGRTNAAHSSSTVKAASSSASSTTRISKP